MICPKFWFLEVPYFTLGIVFKYLFLTIASLGIEVDHVFLNNLYFLYFFLSLVVSRVGRDLAPFLKALVPSWHVLCSDPHIPASIHAKSAFSQAFNGDSTKSRDAILFCQSEILAYIAQNLLQHTASTLSDPK